MQKRQVELAGEAPPPSVNIQSLLVCKSFQQWSQNSPQRRSICPSCPHYNILFLMKKLYSEVQLINPLVSLGVRHHDDDSFVKLC